MYGLVDGPLMFQLAFTYYLKFTLGFRPSMHDDNFLTLHDKMRILIMVIILHPFVAICFSMERIIIIGLRPETPGDY